MKGSKKETHFMIYHVRTHVKNKHKNSFNFERLFLN